MKIMGSRCLKEVPRRTTDSSTQPAQLAAYTEFVFDSLRRTSLPTAKMA